MKKRLSEAKLRAIQITKLIEDRFHFETALHSIINLYVAANEMDDAGKLLQDDFGRRHPAIDIEVTSEAGRGGDP